MWQTGKRMIDWWINRYWLLMSIGARDRKYKLKRKKVNSILKKISWKNNQQLVNCEWIFDISCLSLQLRQLVAPVGPGGPGRDSPSGRPQQRSPRHPLPPRRLSGRHRVTFTLQRRVSRWWRRRETRRNVSVHGNALLQKQKLHLSQKDVTLIWFKGRRDFKLWK